MVQTRILPPKPREKFTHLHPQNANPNMMAQRTGGESVVNVQVVSSNPSKRRKLDLVPPGQRRTASNSSILPPRTTAKNTPIRPLTRIVPPQVQQNVEYWSHSAGPSQASAHSMRSDEEMTTIANNYILRHVRTALASYYQTLSRTEQEDIAFKVTRTLPIARFYTNFNAMIGLRSTAF